MWYVIESDEESFVITWAEERPENAISPGFDNWTDAAEFAFFSM